MQISPISMSANYRNNAVRFKGTEENAKPETANPQKGDDEIVDYGTWGGNYAYPITAGQRRAAEEKQTASTKANVAAQESPEDYYARKIHSTEWSM